MKFTKVTHSAHSVVLTGNASVGKTSLLHRFVSDDVPHGLSSTVGVEFTKR